MSETVVIDVTGRVTVGLDAQLRDAIQEARDAGARNILLNMDRVTKLDSSGIGELVAAHNAISEEGGRLILVALSERIAAILQITQLLGVIESFPDADSALASLGSA